MRISQRILAVAGIAALVLGAAPQAGAVPAGHEAPAPGSARTVTLGTGDRVTVQPDGSTQVRPAAGRERIGFHTVTGGGHSYVVPADAARLVTSGQLDSRLFDVTALSGAENSTVDKKAPSAATYQLTIDYLGPDGQPTTDFFSVLQGLDNWTHEVLHAIDESGTVTLKVAAGSYALDVMLFGPAGESYYLPRPNLAITEDTTITVDPREAKPVSVTPPEPATTGVADVGYQVLGSVTGLESGMSFGADGLAGVHTAQFGPPAPAGTFAAYLNTQWTADSGAFYGLAWAWEDALPTGLAEEVDAADLATVHQEVGAGAAEQTARIAMDPDPLSRFVSTARVVRELPLPGTATAYVTPGVRWTTTVEQPDLTLTSAPRTFGAGQEYAERANHAVFGPALPAAATPWIARYNSTTSDDMIFVDAPLFGDSTGNAGFSTAESAHTALYQGDELVGETPDPGDGNFPVSKEDTEYRISTWAARPAVFDVSTRVSAEWTFRTGHGADRLARIDLSVVRFTPELDETNTAPAGQEFAVPVTLHRADGTTWPSTTLTVDVSYDEGATWQPAEVVDGAVRLHHPAGATSVSLRAGATDDDAGTTVAQTIIRAYRLG